MQSALHFTICLSVHNQHIHFGALHPKRCLIPGNVRKQKEKQKDSYWRKPSQKNGRQMDLTSRPLGFNQPGYLLKTSLMGQHHSQSQLRAPTPLFTDIPTSSPPRQRGASWVTRSCIFCTFLQVKNVNNFYLVPKTKHFVWYVFICTHMFRC